MPNTRVSSAPVIMSAMAWPADRLMNMTSIATNSVTASWSLFSELLANQRRFTVRLLDAMHGQTPTAPQSSNASPVDEAEQRRDSVIESLSSAAAETPRRSRAASKATRSEPEFPIKRYDTLTVQEVVGRLDRLRDRRSIRTVLAYEAKNKSRKGVAAAGEARLERLRDA